MNLFDHFFFILILNFFKWFNIILFVGLKLTQSIILIYGWLLAVTKYNFLKSHSFPPFIISATSMGNSFLFLFFPIFLLPLPLFPFWPNLLSRRSMKKQLKWHQVKQPLIALRICDREQSRKITQTYPQLEPPNRAKPPNFDSFQIWNHACFRWRCSCADKKEEENKRKIHFVTTIINWYLNTN